MSFDLAGFVEDDVIVTELTPDELFQMLPENRGHEVSLTVASGGTDMPPAGQTCRLRAVTSES